MVVAAAIAGTGLGMVAARGFDAGLLAQLAAGLLAGGVWAGLVVIAGSVTLKLNNLTAYTRNTREELRAMVNIRPLLSTVPVSLGGWAMDAQFGELVAQTIFENDPSLIVECGSGSSTILASSCLRALGNEGQVISLDHERKYAEKTRTLVDHHDTGDIVDVVFAPLTNYKMNGRSYAWYDIPEGFFEENSIDILVVDGPPGSLNEKARYPAVPVLRKYLSSTCIILLDDGDRPDERVIAQEWGDLLDAKPAYVSNDKGAWILNLQ